MPDSNLRLLIRPSRNNHTNSQKSDCHHLQSAEPFSPDISSNQCGNAAAGSQNDVYRHRYVVTEGMVVQDIYGEEQKYVYEPSLYGNVIRSKEERWSAFVELGEISRGSHKDKLDESQKGAYCL